MKRPRKSPRKMPASGDDPAHHRRSHRTSDRRSYGRLVRSIGKIIEGRDGLARQAEKQYAVEVENILVAGSRDAQRINRTLDCILDFCFDPAMLGLYKKLCRYYYDIDPVATASYVYAYRDMWDGGEGNRVKEIGSNLES